MNVVRVVLRKLRYHEKKKKMTEIQIFFGGKINTTHFEDMVDS